MILNKPLKSVCISVIAATTMSLATMPVLAEEVVEPSLLDTLEWRLIGPWRGGRVTAVTGVPDDPMLYYMGATGGGVWRTTNAGATWENISDEHFEVGTIGHIAVAPCTISEESFTSCQLPEFTRKGPLICSQLM